jgi:hypothetical protein
MGMCVLVVLVKQLVFGVAQSFRPVSIAGNLRRPRNFLLLLLILLWS